jgi:hypothetical protein
MREGEFLGNWVEGEAENRMPQRDSTSWGRREAPLEMGRGYWRTPFPSDSGHSGSPNSAAVILLVWRVHPHVPGRNASVSRAPTATVQRQNQADLDGPGWSATVGKNRVSFALER